MARTVSWLLNAALRTLQAALPRLARPDDEWALGILERAEQDLYRGMSAPERAHAVKVARCVQGRLVDAPSHALRAALLHDVGKTGSPNTALARALAHLMPAVDLPPSPRSAGIRGALQAKQHHAAYGAEMVMAASGDSRVAELIRRHHDDPATPLAEALAACDETT